MKEQKPSDGEMEILQILWKLKQASVRDIHEELSKTKDSGYTTTLKQVQRMVEKGFLDKNENNSPHLFKSLLDEEETKNQMIERLSQKLFKGSAMEMVMHALGNSKTSKEDLEELKEWLAQKQNDKK